MNDQRLACYYSVVRFCPYPETDEFVNVAVLLACPSVGFFDFKRTRKRRARVSDFFPELNPDIFSSALQSLHNLLVPFRSLPPLNQWLTEMESNRRRDEFLSLVRPRESILLFSPPRVIMTHSPADSLEELFGTYVERNFAHATEYQESQMCKRLEQVLVQHKLIASFKRNEAVGDENFRIRFPFVRFDHLAMHALSAIKALHLDKEEPTDVFKHGDSWLNNIRRLREFGTAPKDLLFVMRPPAPNKAKHLHAFDRVTEDFRREQIPFTTEDHTADLVTFAKG